MTPGSRRILNSELQSDEGFRGKPYLDCCGKYWRECTCATKGRLSVGFGRNLDDVGISRSEGEVLLDHDLAVAESACAKSFSWYPPLTEARQRVVVNMAFNLGLTRLRGFVKMLAAVKAGDYATAADQMLRSKWAGQVKGRADRLARVMREGV